MTSDHNRRARTVSAAVCLSVFLLVSVGVIVVLSATIHPWGSSDEVTYRAEFTDASRLAPGDQVRAAGVVVGRVTEVVLQDDATARVTFTASDELDLTAGTTAQVRYLNLIGDRYLALERGDGARLSPGDTIPLTQTEPALDLNDLFNGFKPLFAALSPDEVNQLSSEIIAVLQGEATTVAQLLQHTADLTTDLADRDVVIGRVVENLNQVLGTVSDRDVELSQLISQLSRFMSGLARDRRSIGEAIDHIDTMAEVTASLLREARPALREDIAALSELARKLTVPATRRQLEHVLDTTARKLARIIRSGAYGSWFNFYMCDLRVDLDSSPGTTSVLDMLFDRIESLSVHDSSARCSG